MGCCSHVVWWSGCCFVDVHVCVLLRGVCHIVVLVCWWFGCLVFGGVRGVGVLVLVVCCSGRAPIAVGVGELVWYLCMVFVCVI